LSEGLRSGGDGFISKRKRHTLRGRKESKIEKRREISCLLKVERGAHVVLRGRQGTEGCRKKKEKKFSWKGFGIGGRG